MAVDSEQGYPFNVHGVYSLLRKVLYSCMDIHKQSKKQMHNPGI
jgi:hypothetical protein